MAVLLVYSACDSGVDVTQDRIDTPPGDLYPDRVVVPPELEAELTSFMEAVQVHIDEEDPIACVSRPLDDVQEEIDAIGERVDSLLNTIQDGLNTENFHDRVADMDSTDWAQADSAAIQTLYNETKGLDAVACMGDSRDLEDMATNIYMEYTHIINSIGWNGLADLMNDIVEEWEEEEAEIFGCFGCIRGFAITVGISVWQSAALLMGCSGPQMMACIGLILTVKGIVMANGLASFISCAKRNCRSSKLKDVIRRI